MYNVHIHVLHVCIEYVYIHIIDMCLYMETICIASLYIQYI